MTSFVHQTLSSVPLAQAFGAEQRNVRRFRFLFNQETDRLRQETVLKGKLGIVGELIPTAGIAIVLYAGGAKVIAGSMAVGSLLVFLAYQRTIQRTFRALLQSFENLKSAEANLERLAEVLNAPEEVAEMPGARPLPARAGTGVGVRWERVVFGYEAGRPVLHGVDLDVRPGERVALVGATGAGKSTLVSLVPRFFDPWEGRVLVDGVDVRTAQLASVRAQVGLVLQDPFLLPMSIADNIAYGRPDATRAEVEAAARAAQSHEFIARLPKGYETVVGERGSTLSGGEKQRLAIARALLKDAPILVLDEPTSALDVETEAALLRALERLMSGRTVFLIAHRLSTVRHADRIVVLQNGRIAETGTHDELLAAGGIYTMLTQSAFRATGAA